MKKKLKVGIVLICCMFLFTTVAFAKYLNYGWPTSNVPIRPYNHNSTWQRALDNGMASWNGAGAKVSFNKVSGSNNPVYVANYSYGAYGKCIIYYSGNKITRFTIEMNNRTISRDATNFSNFIQSVFVHELGHAIWLADNPRTSQPSIMKYSRNRNTMTRPQTFDINNVRAKY